MNNTTGDPTLDRISELDEAADNIPDDQWFDHWTRLHANGGETERVLRAIEFLLGVYLECEQEGNDKAECRYAFRMNYTCITDLFD